MADDVERALADARRDLIEAMKSANRRDFIISKVESTNRPPTEKELSDLDASFQEPSPAAMNQRALARLRSNSEALRAHADAAAKAVEQLEKKLEKQREFVTATEQALEEARQTAADLQSQLEAAEQLADQANEKVTEQAQESSTLAGGGGEAPAATVRVEESF